MCGLRNKGQYADFDGCPPTPESWHFYPRRKSGNLGFSDVVRELFDQGMEGNLYAQLFKVPGEFPADEPNEVVLLEPEDAVKILADWCGYTLHDREGRPVK